MHLFDQVVTQVTSSAVRHRARVYERIATVGGRCVAESTVGLSVLLKFR